VVNGAIAEIVRVVPLAKARASAVIGPLAVSAARVHRAKVVNAKVVNAGAVMTGAAARAARVVKVRINVVAHVTNVAKLPSNSRYPKSTFNSDPKRAVSNPSRAKSR
jgi:hypothetical protein